MPATSLSLGEISFGVFARGEKAEKDRCCFICMRRRIRGESAWGRAVNGGGNWEGLTAAVIIAVRPKMSPAPFSRPYCQKEEKRAWAPPQ